MTPSGVRRLGAGALAPTLGAAAHVEAGGGLPELSVAVGLVAFLTAGLAALAVRRRVGAVRLGIVLAAGQLGWHLALDAGGSSAHGHAEHVGHAAALALPSSSALALPSSGMVAAHALATVLVALGAAGADHAVAAMVGGSGRVGAVLRLLLSAPVVPSAPAAPLVPHPVLVPVSAALLRIRPLRGPPVRPASA